MGMENLDKITLTASRTFQYSYFSNVDTVVDQLDILLVSYTV